MTYLMLCEHKKTKLKLTVAFNGFRYVNCCTTCGCAVKRLEAK